MVFFPIFVRFHCVRNADANGYDARRQPISLLFHTRNCTCFSMLSQLKQNKMKRRNTDDTRAEKESAQCMNVRMYDYKSTMSLCYFECRQKAGDDDDNNNNKHKKK